MLDQIDIIKIAQAGSSAGWFAYGERLGKSIGSTCEFQKIAMRIQQTTGIILDGASPNRSAYGDPANRFWDGFHYGRNQ
jgi:hypothetical protein